MSEIANNDEVRMKDGKIDFTPKQLELFEVQADFCQLFSSSVRLRILWCLAHGPCTVSQMSTSLGLTMTNVSQHLRLMRSKGAVTATRSGRSVIYEIANSKFLRGSELVREGLLEELRKVSR